MLTKGCFGTGCPQCKQRRVKCDETLPSCLKCEARSLRCGYLDYTERELQAIHQAHLEDEDYMRQVHKTNEILMARRALSEAQAAQAALVSQRAQQIQHEQVGQSVVPILPSNYNNNSTNSASSDTISYTYTPSMNGSVEGAELPLLDDPADLVPSALGELPVFLESQHIPVLQETLIPDQHAEGQFFQSPVNLANPHPNQLHPDLYELHPIQQSAKEFVQSGQTRSSNNSSSKSTTFSSKKASSKASPFAPGSAKHTKTVKLMPHKQFQPELSFEDIAKVPEFFHDTIYGATSRAFLRKETEGRFEVAFHFEFLFNGCMLGGLGPLAKDLPEIFNLHFLKYRGLCLNSLITLIDKIDDNTALAVSLLSTFLTLSTVYGDSVKLKDFALLSSGVPMVIETVFENPQKFPNSFKPLKLYADGLLYTAKSVWLPLYNALVLDEFLEVLKDFGEKFIYRIDDFYKIKSQFEDLINYTQYVISFLKSQKLEKYMLFYPVAELFKMFRNWYKIVPSEIFSFGTNEDPVKKVFYLSWFCLSALLNEIVGNCRYIFTYLFDGFQVMFPFERSLIFHNLYDKELTWFANYFCRIMAYLSRRSHYILRNTIFNEPIPHFFDPKDRFKPRSLDIHEKCITNFKDNFIKKFNYPSESSSNAFISASPEKNKNVYYKQATESHDQLVDSLLEFSNVEFDDCQVDLYDVNNETSLLNNDFDPRFTDPIYQQSIVFPSADLNFIKKYNEDRRLLIQLDV